MKMQIVKSKYTGKRYWVIKQLRGPYFVVRENGFSPKYTMPRKQFETVGFVKVDV